MLCGATKQIEVDTEALIAWQHGALIQRCFPDMSVEDRELMISHTCGTCWNNLFSPEDEN
jgi:hypothetical protein